MVIAIVLCIKKNKCIHDISLDMCVFLLEVTTVDQCIHYLHCLSTMMCLHFCHWVVFINVLAYNHTIKLVNTSAWHVPFYPGQLNNRNKHQGLNRCLTCLNTGSVIIYRIYVNAQASIQRNKVHTHTHTHTHIYICMYTWVAIWFETYYSGVQPAAAMYLLCYMHWFH